MKTINLGLCFMILICPFLGHSSDKLSVAHLKGPEVILDPKIYTTFSMKNFKGKQGPEMTTFLRNWLEANLALKFVDRASTDGKGSRRNQKKIKEVVPSLEFEGEYSELSNVEQKTDEQTSTEKYLEGVLKLRVTDNVIGKVLVDTDSKLTSRINYDKTYKNVQVTEDELSRLRLNNFIMALDVFRPYSANVKFEAFYDDKAPELEEGYRQIRLSKFDEALKKFEGLINKTTNQRITGHAHYGQAVAYAFSGNITQARQAIKQALSANPEKGYLKFKDIITEFEKDNLLIQRYQQTRLALVNDEGIIVEF